MTSERPSAVSSERDGLVNAIMAFLAGGDLLTLDDIRSALERDIDDAGAEALRALQERLAATEDGWDYHPPDPLARRIHHFLADRLLQSGSALTGIDHVASVAGNPVAVFANHLSYADANLIEVLLYRSGGASLADRLTALAGPKVFTSRRRRFSSLCFGAIKTPQNAERSSGEAVMSQRDVARAARRTIETARARLRAGDALVIFGEGTRSRTCRMQPLLAGVARYLDENGTWVLPVGITGTEGLFPIGDEALHPVRIGVHVGQPFRAAALRNAAGRDRRLEVDAIGLAIADELPAAYRGVYRERTEELDAARHVLMVSRRPA